MDDDSVELAIEVPTVTKRAIECAAADRGLSVSEFVGRALRKMLAEAQVNPGTK